MTPGRGASPGSSDLSEALSVPLPALAAERSGLLRGLTGSTLSTRARRPAPHGRDRLPALLADDPEMLDLVIGLLLHYDPA